jgi:hypothetical protein
VTLGVNFSAFLPKMLTGSPYRTNLPNRLKLGC